MNEDFLKELIEHRDKINLEYKQRLVDLEKHYGVEFEISYFDNNKINEINFVEIGDYNELKNLSIRYDNFNNFYNFLTYNFTNEKLIKNLNIKKIVAKIEEKFRLRIVIADCNRVNNEYVEELEKIEAQMQFLKENT